MYKLLLISILVVLSRQDSMYSFFQQMLNPNNLQRIAFSQNLKFALLYDESSKSVINYRAYDWPKTSESPFKDLVIYPKSLEFINDPQFDTCIVFGDENGVIYRGGKLEKGQAYFLITQLGIRIKKIYPSQDQTKLAVIQEGGSKVYVGDLNKGTNTFKVLDYPNNLITGVRWRPGKLQLAIVGGNVEANTSVIELYDAETELRFDFHNLTKQILVDVEFSSDSNKLYGLTANSKNDVLLPIFDLTVGKQTGFLSAYLATQLKELKRQGNFLTAFNSDTLFVWNLLTQLFYANHTSTFKTASLSIDGSDFVTNNGGTISVFKLCSDLQHFYVPADNKCLACQTPCVNCFKQKDMCSSCIPKNFLDSNFACVACLDYCLACQNATTCDKCTPGYYFQPAQCKSCAQPLPGCLSCQSKDACKVCDDKNNWVKQKKKCVCDSGFIQINKTCQACPAHCDICTDVKTCQTCDQWSNYDPTPNEEGNCVCATGFFDSNDTCKRCITGCATCNDTESCLECNAFNNWKLEDGKCVCPQDRVANYNFCSKCSAYLTGCSKCSSITNCTECAENYTLNIVTNKCEEVQGANVIVIVVVVIAALAAVGVGGYFVWRMVKKRKAKQMQTILQSEGKDQAEQYEKIEN